MDTDWFEGIALGSARGARGGKAPVGAVAVRELNEADLDLLAGSVGSQITPLAKLRESHHQLARLLAKGTAQVEAAAITGYSQSRISILKHDPSFQELMEYYRGQVEEIFVDANKRLATLGISVIDELQERLEEAPQDFKPRELMELAELCLDRSLTKGQGPGSAAPVSVNVTFVEPPNRESRITGPVIDLDFET